MASVYRRTYRDKKTGKTKKCRTYTIELSSGQRVKGYTDRLATEQRASELEKLLARGEQGLIDPFKEHKARPLSHHIRDYVAYLRELGRAPMYVYTTEKRLSKLASQCGWKALPDITADSLNRWREGVKGIGPVTKNQYLKAASYFCGWCVRPAKRMAANPLADVQKSEESADIRRLRRAWTPEEFTRLIDAVPDYYRLVYRTLVATGLRKQELADLQGRDVRFTQQPHLHLRAEATKGRRADKIRLRADLAEQIRAQIGGPMERVFPDMPSIERHKSYLKAAGIAWKDAEGRQADIHSLRHTCGTWMALAGATPWEIKEHLRHGDVKQTQQYIDSARFLTCTAVDKLPLPPIATPVGTYQIAAGPLVGRLADHSTSQGQSMPLTVSEVGSFRMIPKMKKPPHSQGFSLHFSGFTATSSESGRQDTN